MKSSCLVRRELSLLDQSFGVDSDEAHVAQTKPVVLPSVQLDKSLLVLQVRHPQATSIFLLLAVLGHLELLLPGSCRPSSSALRLKLVDFFVHVSKVLFGRRLKFSLVEWVKCVGKVLLKPSNAVQPWVVCRFLKFVLPVNSIVADAGFANSQGISAVFVKSFCVAALLFGDKLLDFVELGRHVAEVTLLFSSEMQMFVQVWVFIFTVCSANILLAHKKSRSRRSCLKSGFARSPARV